MVSELGNELIVREGGIQNLSLPRGVRSTSPVTQGPKAPRRWLVLACKWEESMIDEPVRVWPAHPQLTEVKVRQAHLSFLRGGWDVRIEPEFNRSPWPTRGAERQTNEEMGRRPSE